MPPSERRPGGVTALSVFFAAAALIGLASAISLLTPGGPLDFMWRLNRPGEAQLASSGPWSVVLMGAVFAACALAAVGLWRGRRWGHRIAIGVFALSFAGNAVKGTFGGQPTALLGLPILVALIAYLMSGPVRRFFAPAPPPG